MPVEIVCPDDKPPVLYELPPRLETARPGDYQAERYVVEGRHEAFKARYGAYEASWRDCAPEDDA